MGLSSSEKAKLKAEAHGLNPVVQIGKNGVTDQAISNIVKALKDHELIKIKFVAHKEEKEPLIREITSRTRADLVGIIGNTATLYKHKDETS